MGRGEGTQFASPKPSSTREEQVSGVRCQVSAIAETWNLAPDTCFLTSVGQHGADVSDVRSRDRGGLAQLALSAAGLRSEDMAGKRVPANNLAPRGNFKALGGTFMSLELRLGQLYPPVDSRDAGGLGAAARGFIEVAVAESPAACRDGAPATFPGTFFGPMIAVRFGPSSLGRVSTAPASPRSSTRRCIICIPRSR